MAVIKGKARAIAGLTEYMLRPGQNEDVELLAVENCISTDPWLATKEMGFIAELSTSAKPCYHGQLSLGKEESKRVTNEQYIDMVHMVREELGLPKDVKTIISKHTKNNGNHIHYDFLLVDPTTGKLHPTWKNYYKHDEARAKIEEKYQLTPTPKRNPNKEEQRDIAKQSWEKTKTGQQFVDFLKARGYDVAFSVKESRALRIIDPQTRNYNLVREIQGATAAQVKERLKDVKLPLDETVMERKRQENVTQAKTTQAQEEGRKVTEAESRRNMEEWFELRRKKNRGYER